MKRWLITSALLALFLPAVEASAQADAGRVTGTITALEGGNPLAGVRVNVLGTRLGAETNAQGRYTISLAPGFYRLRVSGIGFTPTIMDSVPVTTGQTVTADFKLKRQLVQLEQVIVTGYGSQAKRDVTGAVGSVGAEQIHAVATNNAIDAIKGRIPGVDITNSGYKPSDGVRIQIRGQRSIKASNDPLYVLDGVPMAGGIGDLNPNDLESIEILKDASATAIYGSRGANGVVLVTSKKGTGGGKTRISYDTYAARTNPAATIRTFNGPEFAEYKREAYRTANAYPCPGATVCAAGDRATFYQQELDGIKNGTSVDYRDLIQRRGSDVSHQLNVSGGNDRTQFSVSANLVNTIGTIMGQDFNRKSMRVNFESQANDRIRVGGSALVLRSHANDGRGDGEYGLALQLSPLAVAFDSLGKPIFKPTPDPQPVNPVNEVAAYYNQTLRNRAFGTLFANVNLADGLDYRISYGPDLTFFRNGVFIGAETQDKQGSGTSGGIDQRQVFDYTLDNILTYKRAIGASHKLDATFLYSIEKNREERGDTRTSGQPYESQLFYNLGTGSTIDAVSSSLSEWTLQSYMARLNYTLKDRYLLTLTTRADGSSRLAPGNKYAIFPSVALAWRAIDESSSNGIGPISSLKFRMSYGRAGNTSVNPYQTQGNLSRTVYAFGSANGFGYRPGSLPNTNLTWEKTTQMDAGADFELFRGRLSGTLDWYVANTTDLLMDRQLPPTSGYTSITQNIGATRNRGLELSLSHITFDGWHGIRWNNDFVWSRNRNEIVSLVGGVDKDIVNRWFVGQPINNNTSNTNCTSCVYYDYRFLGIWQLADSLEAKKYAQAPGQIRVQDVDGDGKINEADKMIIGNNFPSWTGSWNTRAEYKMLDFSMQVNTRQHFTLMDDFINSNSTLAGRYNGIKVDYWTPTNPSNTDPRPNKNQEFPIYGGTRGYEDGSFTKIRSVTLGVTMPAALAQRVNVTSLRIYVTGQNLKTFTTFKGLDPEGRASAGSPPNRMALVGASFGY
jgi:TonB-linked SusC/RagA family outer membrane protein